MATFGDGSRPALGCPRPSFHLLGQSLLGHRFVASPLGEHATRRLTRSGQASIPDRCRATGLLDDRCLCRRPCYDCFCSRPALSQRRPSARPARDPSGATPARVARRQPDGAGSPRHRPKALVRDRRGRARLRAPCARISLWPSRRPCIRTRRASPGRQALLRLDLSDSPSRLGSLRLVVR